jgi:hypothetical protein
VQSAECNNPAGYPPAYAGCVVSGLGVAPHIRISPINDHIITSTAQVVSYGADTALPMAHIPYLILSRYFCMHCKPYRVGEAADGCSFNSPYRRKLRWRSRRRNWRRRHRRRMVPVDSPPKTTNQHCAYSISEIQSNNIHLRGKSNAGTFLDKFKRGGS